MEVNLVLHAAWSGELAAGIRPGYERVTINFAHGLVIDADMVEYWRESVRDFYDGARVYTEEEWQELLLEDEKAEERRREA